MRFTQWQTDLINQVFNALTDFYCDPEKLNKAALENSLADIFAQFPDKPETKEQYKLFLDEVNKKLKQFDSHLELGFEPEFIAERQGNEIVRSAHSARFDLREAPPSKEWLHDRVEWESKPEINYGFVSQSPASIPDDVGYLKINHLIDPSSGENESEEYQLGPNATKAATAALQKLAGKKAIILDLRESKQGGDPDMVQYVISHFMQQHRGLTIGTGIDTRTNETTTYKVLPTPCDLSNIPVYILTDHTTYSAREAIAYHLKHFNEYVHPGESPVTVIGEKTVGGAHPTYSFPLVDSSGEINKDLIAWIPCGKGINAFTGKDWEGVGVVPDIKVKTDEDALAIALDLHHAATYKKDTVPQAVLDNAKIPAMSAAWHQNNETHSLVGGVADPENSKPADEVTLFQAASLSKVVSAAIILDLAADGKWDLNKPLAEMGVPFGSEEMQNDPRYAELTTRMILAQCSGLPNWFSASEKTFMKDAQPGAYFTYSGEAYEWLKQVVEKQFAPKTWGELAQEFFDKARMQHSTFQLPENTHLKDSTIARGHTGDGTPSPVPSSEGFKEVPAASLLTTSEDYVRFLRYCHSQPPSADPAVPSLRDLFTSSTHLDPIAHPEAHEKITWGLGMGVFKEGEREIAFHWGNNPTSHAFCAMDMKTGDAVACLVNSENGCNVFQILSEEIVGKMDPVFELLANYCGFKSVVKSESPEALQAWADDVVTRPLSSMLLPKPEPTPQKAREEERDEVSIRALPRMGLMGSGHVFVGNAVPAPEIKPIDDQEDKKELGQ
ncbi:MAG: serine hydrolase [Coxiellaceae bacterium]|nr:serine hydrolase [Coxiellaceae bacterium]